MGIIKNLLAKCNFGFDSYFQNDLRLEVSEAIHLHYRDMRILMTPTQFNNFVICIIRASIKWNGKIAESDTLLKSVKLDDDQIFKDDATIEEQENSCFHFHYRDMRLELNNQAFIEICNLFENAKSNYLGSKVKMIPLDLINPYDHIHFATKKEWLGIEGYSEEHLIKDYYNHISGIVWMKDKIKQGFEIVPIVVTKIDDNRYKRRDGYKRYMAYKRLGIEEIPCYIVDEETALTCFQHNQFPFK